MNRILAKLDEVKRSGKEIFVPVLKALLNDTSKPLGSAWSMGEQAKRALAALGVT